MSQKLNTMKKSILAGLFLLNCMGGIFAQEGMRFGVQVSPTLSWMQSNDKTIRSNGSMIGIQIGMLGEFYFAENYALVTGLGLSFQQGGTLKHDQGGNFWANSTLSNSEMYQLPNGINTRYHIQYLEIPLALRMRTREFGYLRYFAEIPRFLFGIRTKATGDLEGAVNSEDELITSDVNPLSVSWGAGAGIEYSISPSTAFIAGLFYQSSIIDVTRNKKASKYLYDSAMNIIESADEHSIGSLNALSLRIGLMF